LLLRRFAIPYASQARSLKERYRQALSSFKDVLIYHYDDFFDKAKAFFALSRPLGTPWRQPLAFLSLMARAFRSWFDRFRDRRAVVALRATPPRIGLLGWDFVHLRVALVLVNAPSSLQAASSLS